jgi:hypothetical protein
VIGAVFHVPHRELEQKFQEISGNANYGTYPWRFIQGEIRGMDLHIGTAQRKNSSALEVACPPPGIGAKKSRKVLRTASELLT